MTNKQCGPDQTAPIGAVCSGSTPFASILNLSVMLDDYLQQTTSTDDINFSDAFFLGALRVNINKTSRCTKQAWFIRKYRMLHRSSIKGFLCMLNSF